MGEVFERNSDEKSAPTPPMSAKLRRVAADIFTDDRVRTWK